MDDRVCPHCGALFGRRVGARPDANLLLGSRRRAAHERRTLRRASTLEPFDAGSLEPWTLDDDGGLPGSP
jgi:hypothetical protein